MLLLHCSPLLILWLAGCWAEDALPWWRTAVFYQVYPRSFKDGDGDGVGDLKGITEAADYFKEIGVDAIWLSPINKSPMVDFGYDISDFLDIDPLFGTMEDFDNLRAKLNEIDVKLLLDFVPNHTSDQHMWFQISKNPNHTLYEDYKDFYVWRDANGTDPDTGKPIPPNNWISVFSGSAWEWNDDRKQFYLHAFTVQQPDLNYRCPQVLSNMTAVLQFWLGKGVDGFRIDAPKFIYENSSFPNQDPVPGTEGDTYETMQHNYDTNQPEDYALMAYWTDLVHEWVVKDGRERALFLEAYNPIDIIMNYYGKPENRSMQITFNFMMVEQVSQFARPVDLKRLIDLWMTSMPSYAVPNWVTGNHDNSRMANLYGYEMVDAINLLSGVLPGVKVVYYGEEIGMPDTFILWNQTVDPRGILVGPDEYWTQSRDPERTPLQWDDSISAGFSSNSTTWLPVNPNYWWLNIAAQRAAPTSHLKVFQAMATARKDPVLQRGDYQVVVPNEFTLLVVRTYEGSAFVLIINMGSDVNAYTSDNLFQPNNLDVDMTVVVGSVQSGYTPGLKLYKGAQFLSLRPKAAVLLRSGITASPAPATSSPTSSTTRLPETVFTLLLLLHCMLLLVLKI